MHALDGWEWLFVERRPELSALLIHSPGEGLGYQVQGIDLETQFQAINIKWNLFHTITSVAPRLHLVLVGIQAEWCHLYKCYSQTE